jgi:hypothetical protein
MLRVARVDLLNLLQTDLRVSMMTTCFKPKGRTMQEVGLQQRWSHNFNEVDREAQIKQALDSLEIENGQLKQLVVRLSETIIRTVVARR